jgi:hypothetical protein
MQGARPKDGGVKIFNSVCQNTTNNAVAKLCVRPHVGVRP